MIWRVSWAVLARVGAAAPVWMLVCAVSFVCVLGSSTAHASHYRLGESGLLTQTEQKALAKAGVTTTKELVDAAGPKKARRVLARQTRIKVRRLRALAQTCDLLRISGLGTIMARLLQASGVPDTGVLRVKRADSLAQVVKATNAKNRISEIVPDARTLRTWIAQAKRLSSIVEP